MRRTAVAAPAPDDDGWDSARVRLARRLAANPDDVEAAHSIALIIGFEGDMEASIQALADLVQRHPEDVAIRYDLAMAQMMSGDTDSACRHLQRILQLDPSHEKARQQSAYC